MASFRSAAVRETPAWQGQETEKEPRSQIARKIANFSGKGKERETNLVTLSLNPPTQRIRPTHLITMTLPLNAGGSFASAATMSSSQSNTRAGPLNFRPSLPAEGIKSDVWETNKGDFG